MNPNYDYAPRQSVTPYVAKIPATAEAIESAKNSLQTQTLELPKIDAPAPILSVEKAVQRSGAHSPRVPLARTLLEINKLDLKTAADKTAADKTAGEKTAAEKIADEKTAVRKVAKTLLELKTPEIQIPEIKLPDLKKKALTKPARERSKTMMEAGSVDPKAIRRLLQSEFGSSPKNADETDFGPPRKSTAIKVAKTLAECFTPAPIVDRFATGPIVDRFALGPIVDRSASGSIIDRFTPAPSVNNLPSAPIVDDPSPRRNYVAKTRLDRMAIAEVVLRFEQRKEERKAEIANEDPMVEVLDYSDFEETLGGSAEQSENGEFWAENRRELVNSRRMLLAIVALAIISLVMVLIVPPAASPLDGSLNLKLWASLGLTSCNLEESQS